MIPWLLWIGAAIAGIPLVYDADPAAAAAAADLAARSTGLPDDQFDPVALDGLLKGLPEVVGDAVVRHCAGPPTRAPELLANTVRAESAWQQGDAIVAMDELDLGISGLGCLSDRVDPGVMSRLFLLRGGLLARGGRPDEARAELRTALSVSATRAWPEGFPAEGAALFAEIQTEPGRVPLHLAPAASGAAPVVNGATMPAGSPLQLRPGLHLLQIPSTAGLRSAWLTVSGPATLVVPTSYRRPVLERLADPERRPEVALPLLSTLDSPAVYVTHHGGLWLLSAQGTDPQITVLVEPSEEAKETGKKGKKDKKGKREDAPILPPEPELPEGE